MEVSDTSAASGNGGSGSGSSGNGGSNNNQFSPQRGYDGRSNKYRTPRSITTTQTTPPPSSQPPTSQPQKPAEKSVSPITGAAVANIESPEFFKNILGAFIKPTEKEIGLVFLLAVLAILIGHICINIRMKGKIYNKTANTPPKNQTQNTGFISLFKKTYSTKEIPKTLDRVNSGYLSKKQGRNINIRKTLPSNKIKLNKVNTIEALKEVYSK